MAPVTAGRFARFDAELEDSDQTLDPMVLSRSAGGVSRPWSQGLGGARPRPRSTFFPDSTDEEDTRRLEARGGARPSPPPPQQQQQRPLGSLAGHSIGPRSMASSAMATATIGHGDLEPRVFYGNVQFPVTRHVLWDRRTLAGPFEIDNAGLLPRVTVPNGLLKQLHQRLAAPSPASSTISTRLCVGVVERDRTDHGPSGRPTGISITRLVEHERHAGPNALCIPIYKGPASATTMTDNEREQRARDRQTLAMRALDRLRTTAASHNDALLPLLLSASHLLVTTPAEGSHAELRIELETMIPAVRARLGLVRSLPLLMTPLAASLTRAEFGPTRRFGFLTLDRARKAVPLLESDPLVLERPIVGLWVYGIAIPDAAITQATQPTLVGDGPFLLEALLRYRLSKIVKERAHVDDGRAFLVAVFAGSSGEDHGPLPRFFECCFADEDPRWQTAAAWASHDSSGITWGLGYGRGRCLAGAASFKGDLVLDVVVEGPECDDPAPQSVRPPVDSLSTRQQHEPDATRSLRQGPHAMELRRSQRDAEPRSMTPLEESPRRPLRSSSDGVRTSHAGPTHTNSVNDIEPVARHDPVCCCHQERSLSAEHHRQLERQATQLRDLQRQIEELQRQLAETRVENSRLLSSLSSSGSSCDHDRRLQTSDLNVSRRYETALASGPSEQNNADADAHAPTAHAAPHAENDGENASVDEAVAPVVTEGPRSPIGTRLADVSVASSLALSSISQHSRESDLSSLSSSVVGPRLRRLIDPPRTKEPTDAPDAVHEPSTGSEEGEAIEAIAITEPPSHSHGSGLGMTMDVGGADWRGVDVAEGEEETRVVEQVESPPVSTAHPPRRRPRPRCEREDSDCGDENNLTSESLLAARLQIPRTPNRDGIVPQGLLSAYVFANGGSFSIPTIKYNPDRAIPEADDDDDDDDDELRRIESKYRRQLACR